MVLRTAMSTASLTTTSAWTSLSSSRSLFFYAISTCNALFLVFQIYSLETSPSSPGDAAASLRLYAAVTFLPLKDLRYSTVPLHNHTWFMSTLNDTQADPGGVQFQHFPSPASLGRLLCLKGRDRRNGAWNSYALAWPDALPVGSVLVSNLTFVSYNHYEYSNIWHGMTAVLPFVGWYVANGCSASPSRWVLYHWGELRTQMSPWLHHLIAAVFGGSQHVEGYDGGGDVSAEAESWCFEEAVVMRHNEGGMSTERRLEAFDFMRYKAREYCNVSVEVVEGGNGSSGREAAKNKIGMTLLMRTGPRAFRNESAVVEIFERECVKVDGCRLVVAQSDDLGFCDQVKLMSKTDILVSPHGAQLTNIFLMDRNSSVMEFFPKGWLRFAGIGQYVYRHVANWSGMCHQGAWRDPNGPHCRFTDKLHCLPLFKSLPIGHNDTFFAEWARRVLHDVKSRKKIQAPAAESAVGCACGCGFHH